MAQRLAIPENLTREKKFNVDKLFKLLRALSKLKEIIHVMQ